MTLSIQKNNNTMYELIYSPLRITKCEYFTIFVSFPPHKWASLVAQLVKNSAAMQEIQVQSLGREDLLEKEMATHSSILAWEIPWTEEPGGLQSIGWQRVGHY